jgi:hypothetical protein
VDPGGARTDYSFLLSQYGAQVVSRVNFDRQRVRASYSFDLAGGVTLLRRDHGAVTLEAEAVNLTNRVNVVNFASLFSGTALGTPRSASVQLKVRY